MPHGIRQYLECSKKRIEYKKANEFKPQKHQLYTMDYFLKVTAQKDLSVQQNEMSKYTGVESYYNQDLLKGLLLYHQVGSGKTCTSLLIANRMLEEKKVDKVYILSPGSLRGGWEKDYCEKCGGTPESFTRDYIFITYNANIRKDREIDKYDFNNSLVIVDEIHNLINGVKNNIGDVKLKGDYASLNKKTRERKKKLNANSAILYDKIHHSSCKLLALSGTPIFRNLYEWPLLMMLLSPDNKLFANVKSVYTDKIDESIFISQFRYNSNGTMFPKSPVKYYNRMMGMISYYYPTGDDYPEVINMPPIQVRMRSDQNNNYWIVATKEAKLRRTKLRRTKGMSADDYERKKIQRILAVNYVLSRQASNCYYPMDLKIEKDATVSNKGWVSSKNLMDGMLLTMSTKIVALILNIITHPKSKHVVFTFAKSKSGVNLIHALFSLCGLTPLIFSGDVSHKDRIKVLSRFNALRNRGGKYYNVLLLTTAGAEGITIKEAQHMHILESSPRPNLIKQAIGRVVRYESHSLLKKKERVVRVWRYWSLSTNDDKDVEVKVMAKDKDQQIYVKNTKTVTAGETVDIELYKRGQKETVAIDSFLDFIKIIKIENLSVEPDFKKLRDRLLMIPPIEALPLPPPSLNYNIEKISYVDEGDDEGGDEGNVKQIMKDEENEEKMKDEDEIIGEVEDDEDIMEIYDDEELGEFNSKRLGAILGLYTDVDISGFSKGRLIEMIRNYQDAI